MGELIYGVYNERVCFKRGCVGKALEEKHGLRLLASRISSGKVIGSLHLSIPVSGAENEYHERSARGLSRKQPKPEPRKTHFHDEPEENSDGHAHQIKRGQVDVGSDGGPGAAAEDAAASGLRAVAELAEADDGEHGGGEVKNFGVRSEESAPLMPRPMAQASETIMEMRALAGRLAPSSLPTRGGGEDVDEGGGLDEDAHGSNGGFGVEEKAAEDYHEFVPPPLEADRDAGGNRKCKQSELDAGEVDEGGEEEEEVEVGPYHGYGDAGDSHFEGQCDALGTEVDAERVEEGEEKEVWDGEEDEGLCGGGYLVYGLHVEPGEGDGDGGGEEEEDGSLEGQAQRFPLFCAPVMLAKPIDREPPASSISPRYPKNSIEIMALEYKSNPVSAVGTDIFPSAFISAITCTNALQNYKLAICEVHPEVDDEAEVMMWAFVGHRNGDDEDGLGLHMMDILCIVTKGSLNTEEQVSWLGLSDRAVRCEGKGEGECVFMNEKLALQRVKEREKLERKKCCMEVHGGNRPSLCLENIK
ncbi:hypothetical protein V8G54_005928 [Vigna mungo]|uniref:Uncharacterized protein n=1 Tax=Vigna mungo TaxID=3915 RepID=A0AAQ3P0N3_VIGMU